MFCCCCDEAEEPDTPPAVRRRGCTDLPCLLVLVACWCCCLFVGTFAIGYSMPALLIGGADSFGNICGAAADSIAPGGGGDTSLSGRDMQSRPYLFLQDAERPERALALCVRRCPPRQLNTIVDVNAFFAETGSQLCRYDFNRHAYNFSGLVAAAAAGQPVFPGCPPLPVPASMPVQGRCVPTPANNVTDDVIFIALTELNETSFVHQLAASLYRARWQLTALAALALLLTLLLVALLPLLGAVLPAAAAAATLPAAAGLLWWLYASLRHRLDNTPPPLLLHVAGRNEASLLTAAVITSVAALLLLAAVIHFWRRLRLASQLLAEAAGCLRQLPGLLLLPPTTAVVQLAVIAAGVVLVVALGSTAHPERAATAAAGQPERLVLMQPETWPPHVWWAAPALLLWTLHWLDACQHLVTAGTVCRWFFSDRRCRRRRRRRRDGSREALSSSSSCLVMRSLAAVACRHLGTAALGSFLVTMLRLPRVIFVILGRSDKDMAAKCCCTCRRRSCSPAGAAAACCQRFLGCLHHCLSLITKHAYTVTAMDGRGFCEAARAATAALATSAGAAASVAIAGSLAIFCGKLLVTVAVTAAALLWLRTDQEVVLYAAPSLVAALLAFSISGCLLGQLEAVMEALLLCYCQDAATSGDGSSEMDQLDGGGGSAGGFSSPKLARTMQALGAAPPRSLPMWSTKAPTLLTEVKRQEEVKTPLMQCAGKVAVSKASPPPIETAL